MKKSICFWISVCVIFAGLQLIPVSTVSAADKVTKVAGTEAYSGGKEYGVITGKTSSGKTVWTYKTKKYTPVQLPCYSYAVKGNRVYVLDYGKLVILNKQTGKAKNRSKRYGHLRGMAMTVIDKKGNIYLQSMYDSHIYSFSKKAKLRWSIDLKDSDSRYFYIDEMYERSGRLEIVELDATYLEDNAIAAWYTIDCSDGTVINKIVQPMNN